jgi:hypothetical protein
MKPLPKHLLALTLVLSGATFLHALALIAFAFLAADRPIWILFGFEVVVLVSAVLGLQFARGKYQEAQGLGAACIGGTIALCSFLAWLAASKVTFSFAAGALIIKSYLITRAAVGAWFFLLAAFAVLTRNPLSFAYLKRAVIAGAILVAAAAATFKFRGAISSWLASTPGGIQAVAIGFMMLVAGVLICITGHCTIRAFELGRDPSESPQQSA